VHTSYCLYTSLICVDDSGYPEKHKNGLSSEIQ
jgi:hypothetical protein